MSYRLVDTMGAYRRVGGTDEDADSAFDEFMATARAALSRLATLAAALQTAATDLPSQGVGDSVLNFATVRGPRDLDAAQAARDPVRIAKAQQATHNITQLAEEELVDDVVERFLTLNLLSAAKSDEVKEALRSIPPPMKDGTPWYVWAGLGVVSLGVLGCFIRAFK